MQHRKLNNLKKERKKERVSYVSCNFKREKHIRIEQKKKIGKKEGQLPR